MSTRALLSPHLPLEGGGRRAKPGGWGWAVYCHPTPARRKCGSPTIPLQGRIKGGFAAAAE